jgi:hypothetical protein
MNGWLRLTRINGKKINVNPLQMAWFAESSEDLLSCFNMEPAKGATALAIGALIVQVQEPERQIMDMYSRLTDKLIKKQQNSVLDLRKRLDREEWQEEEE